MMTIPNFKNAIICLIFTFSLFLISEVVYCQNIKVYFTKSVDNNASAVTNAQYSSHLEDTIVKMIDETNSTLDIAVWDNGSAKIVTALNNAYSRGVQVRYITSDNAFNSALSGLNSSIPVLQRDATATSNVMHNKFIISDLQNLLIGSMNFGLGSMEDDFNNIVIINDASLCNAYLTEFNEMWGSSTANYNLVNSKFGIDKSDNTTHNFTIGSVAVESYFSPTDQTSSHIISSISSADYTCFVSMFTLTHNDIGDELIAAKNRGVDVRVIMENESYIGSEYNNLVNAGISVISHESLPFDYHHKYAVIDAGYVSSDPLVITGSHNWTNSAEEEYDENTLIIHDEITAGNYLEEFTQRWNENTTAAREFIKAEDLIFYALGSDFIEVKTNEKYDWQIIDVNGKIVSKKMDFTGKISVGDLENGTYFIQVRSENLVGVSEFVILK
jgi:phosphatidylserine/phosphatidylglycerophosphate/cardiolipin synthase-like enzyme